MTRDIDMGFVCLSLYLSVCLSVTCVETNIHIDILFSLSAAIILARK